ATLIALSGARPTYGLAAAGGAMLRPGPAPAVLARMRARPGVPGTAAALLAIAGRMWTVSVIPPAARGPALAVPPMVGAWAVTVQCYGGAPTVARGLAATLVGRARFREFGLASLTALGIVLLAADAVGLVVVLAAALTTLALRLAAYRRPGGLTGRLLLA